jgi:HPr kinase/phosphorylase
MARNEKKDAVISSTPNQSQFPGAKLPVVATSRPSAEVIDVLRIYLAKALAPHCSMHGVFMDVLGMGVLIAGESGLGKSELALELISRGHGLVADDVVDFARVAPDAARILLDVELPGLNGIEAVGLGWVYQRVGAC